MDWTTASLAAAMFLLVTQLLCVDSMTPELTFSLYSATVSLPLLLATYGLPLGPQHLPRGFLHSTLVIGSQVGILSGLLSVAAMFFYFSTGVGWLFAATSIATLTANRLCARGTAPRGWTRGY
jgi:hypothetical protein